ncbi:MAG: hypothetical protein NUV50_03015 [Rhodospirillales bacterium]|nr:hypothetical protein [Rhodospirillales bacterium]
MRIKRKLLPIPPWAENSLQGITYWIGHRRCLYKNYPLSEGALVAEVCNLIHANLSDNFTLHCEEQYSSLIKDDNRLAKRARADLVITKKVTGNSEKPTPKFVIEVKRASAPKKKIDEDLARLSVVREHLTNVRAFLFVIAEAHRPSRFVNEDGTSILGKHQIPYSTGYFRVRRTWKAAHAYTKRDRAQYACLLEVYPPTTNVRRRIKPLTKRSN